MDYQYPIDYEWSTDEIVKVISFFQGIEKAYENGIEREQLMNLYNEFKRMFLLNLRKRNCAMSLKK